jgi:hypothetical protein
MRPTLIPASSRRNRTGCGPGNSPNGVRSFRSIGRWSEPTLGFRCVATAGRRPQSGYAAPGSDGNVVRVAFPRCGQAGCRDLPRSLVDCRGGRGARPSPDLVALAAHRSAQRRCHMGRRGSRPRPQFGHQPEAGRHSGLQPRNDRAVRERPTGRPAKPGLSADGKSHVQNMTRRVESPFRRHPRIRPGRKPGDKSSSCPRTSAVVEVTDAFQPDRIRSRLSWLFPNFRRPPLLPDQPFPPSAPRPDPFRP